MPKKSVLKSFSRDSAERNSGDTIKWGMTNVKTQMPSEFQSSNAKGEKSLKPEITGRSGFSRETTLSFRRSISA